MAAVRAKAQLPVGSAEWIKSERDQLHAFVDAEVEEFSYSARNELAWLNEHMADIFSKNVTDVFKTPGKLRGKTPRTARNKDAHRAPLTDLFAPNPQSTTSPARSTPFFQKISKLNVAQDPQPENKPIPRPRQANADSGYHGMTEDDMDVDAPTMRLQQPSPRPPKTQAQPQAQDPQPRLLLSVEHRVTDESFVSTQEGLDFAAAAGDLVSAPADEDMADAGMDQTVPAPADNNEISIHEDDAEATPTVATKTDLASDVSSPEKPLVRKSSLNFASLPPRQTLVGKRSIGGAPAHGVLGDRSLETEITEIKPTNATALEHNKTSTQRLHEKINMLGQTKQPRPSKSIPALYPSIARPSPLPETAQPLTVHDDDDSWIAPIIDRASITSEKDEKPLPKSPAKLGVGAASKVYGQQKSISTSDLASPTKSKLAPEERQQKARSVCAPSDMKALASASTPASSPKKGADGPLSASKARFYSVLKSAKGMFAGGAATTTQQKTQAPESARTASTTTKMPGAFDDETPAVTSKDSARPLPRFPSPVKEGRRTRSSTEGERKVNEVEKMRDQERSKATEQTLEEKTMQLESELADREGSAAIESDSHDQVPTAKTPQTAGKLRAPARLVKPARSGPPPSARPVPVNIRVASQAQRLGVPASASSANLGAEPIIPERASSAVSRPGLNRVGSGAPASNARVKALEAAARKKELEEKAAARKAEQKKELERKRALKLEEEHKAEQEKRAEEAKKAQEARIAAQRQVEQRKLEQQRREAIAAKAKAEVELAEALEREKMRTAAPTRADAPGTIRQLAKATVVQEKTVKRAAPEELKEPTRTSIMNRGLAGYQQQDAKRRRTDDEDELEERGRHSVMAPPKRPSNMRKETISRFPHGYAHAPPPAAHHAQNIYKASVAPAAQSMHHTIKAVQPSDTVKLSTARIPFADGSNAPATTYAEPTAQQQTKTPTASKFKTPARPAQHLSAMTKSSPAYPNGDNIALPEINTDSEDEESGSDADSAASPGTRAATAAFRAPSWVASPALRDLLTQQQLVDPESVFGPIAALNMDEVFRGAAGKNGERIRRYRERGESAMWVESGDAVTSAEKRRDREARERVAREGAWSFQN